MLLADSGDITWIGQSSQKVNETGNTEHTHKICLDKHLVCM